MEVESWKEIPGYEGCYEASTHKRVRSIERSVGAGEGRTRRLRSRIINPSVNETQPRVMLSRDGKTVVWKVSELFEMTYPEQAVKTVLDDIWQMEFEEDQRDHVFDTEGSDDR